MHNEAVAALQNQTAAAAYETAADAVEPGPSAMPSRGARYHEYLSIHHTVKAAKINQALLKQDQDAAMKALRDAEAARNAACR